MIPFKKLTLLVPVLLGLAPGFSCAAPIPVESFKKNPSGLMLKMQPGVMRLEVCGGRTIHVVYSPTDAIPKTPALAVEKQPAPGAFDVKSDAATVTLKVGECSVQVNRTTGALTFLDKQGHPFLSEQPDGGKIFLASEVAGIKTNIVNQKFVLGDGEAVFGLGQHPENGMNYAGQKVHLLQENMHVAVPVFVSSKGYGIFWNNAAVTDVTVGKSTDANPAIELQSEFGNSIDYYVFFGPELDDVISGYRELTGSAPMFARWGWGFWQCKERYKSQQELLDVVDRYRQMHAPIDGIIQDWRYWDPAPWGSHEFDPKRYPDPKKMTQQLHAENVHLLISVWPKFDLDSDNANALRKAGYLYEQRIPYVYPKGQGQWYDAFNSGARHLYWQQISKQLFSVGADGWWLDASEPELGGKWGEYRDFKTAAGPGAQVFNAFPLMHTEGVYKGQRAENPGKRVFILTRSAYAGQQRNAAVTWSGDVKGTWDVFQKQIPAGINFCLSGIPYWNTDTGGFFSGDPADAKYAELFTRWFQFSAFCPMFRVHGTEHPKEIWRFDAATQSVLVDYDKLRYHLLPYIYSVAWKVTHGNSTMMRGLVMDFRADAKVYDIPDQYMFGPALMACPVTQPAAQTRSVYLPAGTMWCDFWTGQTVPGGQTVEAAAPIQTMPIYVRAGSIIPYGPEVQSAMEKADPVELRIYRGADGAFDFYEDENDNYNYEKGAHATIPISWNEKNQVLTIGTRKGQFPGMLKQRTFRIVWVDGKHGTGIESTAKADVELPYSGKAVTVPFK